MANTHGDNFSVTNAGDLISKGEITLGETNGTVTLSKRMRRLPSREI